MYERNVARILALVKKNDEWRDSCLNLIASETPLSDLIREELGGHDLHKRYAERDSEGNYYYHGNKIFKEIEKETQLSLKTLFPYYKNIEFRHISGTGANEAVFKTYLKHYSRVLVNNTSSGGHISHYFRGALGNITQLIDKFDLTDDGYHLDVDKAKDKIWKKKPNMIVLGKSLFLFPEPVNELRTVCNETKTTIVYDSAHVLGLIAGGKFQNPFEEGADIVTGSTHKTFPGPQRGIIFSNLDEEIWKEIEKKTFPGTVSNHHLATVPLLGVAAYEMLDFGKDYVEQIIKNAKTLGAELYSSGFDVKAKEFDYTESHQIIIDVSKWGGGKKVGDTLEKNNIILNMNLLPREPLSKHLNPDGVRIGVQEMTRYGMKEEDIRYIAYLIKECLINNKDVKEEGIKIRQKFNKTTYCHNRETISSLVNEILDKIEI